MGISLGGIGGSPTEDVVRQLITLEKRPGILLAQKQKSLNTGTKVFQNLNSQLASLTSATQGISGKKGKSDKTSDSIGIWGAARGPSDNKGVIAEAETGARVGSVEFDVVSKVDTEREVYNTKALTTLTDEMVEGDGSFSIRIGNEVINIKSASASMEDMAKTINAVKDVGMSATVVELRGQNSEEEKMFQIVGRDTGKNEDNFCIFAGGIVKSAGSDKDKIEYDAASRSITYTSTDYGKAKAVLRDGEEVQGPEVPHKNATDAHIKMYDKDYFYASNKLELMDRATVDISGAEQQKNVDGKNVTGEALRWETRGTSTVSTQDGATGTGKPSSTGPKPVEKNGVELVARGVKVNLIEDGDMATKKVESMVSVLDEVLGTLSQSVKSVEKIHTEEDGTQSEWEIPGALPNFVGHTVQSQIDSVVSKGITIKDAKGSSQTYSLNNLGIELKIDRDTKEMSVNFRSAKLKELIERSLKTTQKLATTLGDKVGEIGRRLFDSSEGMVTKTIDSRKSESDYYDRRTDGFQQHISAEEENMGKQYARSQTVLAAFGQK